MRIIGLSDDPDRLGSMIRIGTELANYAPTPAARGDSRGGSARPEDLARLAGARGAGDRLTLRGDTPWVLAHHNTGSLQPRDLRRLYRP